MCWYIIGYKRGNEKILDKQKTIFSKEDDIRSLVLNDNCVQGREGILGRGNIMIKDLDKFLVNSVDGKEGDQYNLV